jgi:hypothetical protein
MGKDDEAKRIILARRARFIAAAVTIHAGVAACGKTDETAQPCLSVAPADGSAPQPCLSVAEPPRDAGDASPQPCLSPLPPDAGDASDDGPGDAGDAD